MSNSVFVPDATWYKDWLRCREYARLRHELGIVSTVVAEAPRAGQAWHAAMHAWFGRSGFAERYDSGPAYAAAKEALLKAWPDEPLFAAEKQKRPRGLYEALLSEYAAQWPREDDRFEVLEQERWVQADFPFGPYGGRLDMRVRWDDGNIYVWDCKTTSLYLGERYFEGWQMDPQMRGYVALQRVLGRECAGAIIDAVHTDTRYHRTRPKSAPTSRPSPYLQRSAPIRFRDDQIDEWARDIDRALGEHNDFQIKYPAARWPQNGTACHHFNKRCQYWELCTRREELLAPIYELAEGDTHTVPTTDVAGLVEFVKESWRPDQ